MAKKVITKVIDAWISGADSDKISSIITDGDVHRCSFSNMDMSEYWTKVGKATIIVEIDDEDAIMVGAVYALKNAIREVQAEAQAKINHFELQISKLTAIGYTVDTPATAATIEA